MSSELSRILSLLNMSDVLRFEDVHETTEFEDTSHLATLASTLGMARRRKPFHRMGTELHLLELTPMQAQGLLGTRGAGAVATFSIQHGAVNMGERRYYVGATLGDIMEGGVGMIVMDAVRMMIVSEVSAMH